MKKITPARIVCLLAAVIMIVLGVLLSKADVSYTETSMSLIRSHKGSVGQLNEETPVAQTFRATENGLNSLEVMFTNYNQKPGSGTLTLYLVNEAGSEIARADYSVPEVKNNASLVLQLPAALPDSAGQKYTLYAKSDCTEKKGVTLKKGALDGENPDVVLTEADGSVNTAEALYLQVIYQASSSNWMLLITFMLPALSLIACIPLVSKKEKKNA